MQHAGYPAGLRQAALDGLEVAGAGPVRADTSTTIITTNLGRESRMRTRKFIARRSLLPEVRFHADKSSSIRSRIQPPASGRNRWPECSNPAR